MSKKKLIIAGVIIIGLSITAYWFLFNKPVRHGPLVNELPELNVLKTDGSSMSLRDAEDKSVLIFFNPDCDHCQREATQISQRKNIFKDYIVYFISIDSIPAIEKFARDYDLIEDNFVFAQADNYQVYVAIGALQSVPAIFIYNEKKLVKRTEGEVKLEELMKYL